MWIYNVAILRANCMICLKYLLVCIVCIVCVYGGGEKRVCVCVCFKNVSRGYSRTSLVCPSFILPWPLSNPHSTTSHLLRPGPAIRKNASSFSNSHTSTCSNSTNSSRGLPSLVLNCSGSPTGLSVEAVHIAIDWVPLMLPNSAAFCHV